ncbi:MAG: asparagine synthase (glutamine-hydrolyzing) [Parvularculaceae bacterium]|nr:asparagine synthase (glutamine-hydrolyzing) [Parvularculaceae bacterium]
MCGITGVFYANDESVPDRSRIAESVRQLRHRGPDADSFVSGPGFALGHARLSLVDLDPRSNQPFADATGRYLLVYNGEVYNFRELRAELEMAGRVFRTQSDTEVVLELLIAEGPAAALPRLNGMFALGFYDRQTGELTLARDRFGMKPLFWAETTLPGGCGLAFASEIKALRPWMTLTPESGVLTAYLMKFGGPMQGKTMFRGVKGLAPGEMLTFDRSGQTRQRRFAPLTDFLDGSELDRLAGLTPDQAVDEFDERINAAVKSHLFADARVGAFCSGGVDSSLIVSLAARQDRGVALFHANVEGPWSEVEPARALARHLGCELNVVDVTEQDFVDMIPKVIRHYEQPFTYHPNCPPLMMVAQLARDKGVKGLLSGEGSDELFLGYPWLGRKSLTDAYEKIIGLGTKLVRSIPGIGPILAPNRSANFSEVMGILTNREMADDFEQVEAGLRDHRQTHGDATYGWSLDYMHHHLRTLLHRNDTMGMAASIEARFPFLDLGVAKFGVNLPGRFKLRRSPFVFEKAHPFVRDKWVVRSVADRYMPRDLSQRIKIGFWTTTFQRMEASPAFYATSRLGDYLGLGASQLKSTVENADHDLRLRLLHCDVWTRVMIEGEDPEISVGRLRDHVHIRKHGESPRYVRKVGAVRSASAPI